MAQQPSSGPTFDLVAVAGAAIATNRRLAAYIAEAAALADALTDNDRSDLALDLLRHSAQGVELMERVMGLTAPPDAIDQLLAAALAATAQADEGDTAHG